MKTDNARETGDQPTGKDDAPSDDPAARDHPDLPPKDGGGNSLDKGTELPGKDPTRDAPSRVDIPGVDKPQPLNGKQKIKSEHDAEKDPAGHLKEKVEEGVAH